MKLSKPRLRPPGTKRDVFALPQLPEATLSTAEEEAQAAVVAVNHLPALHTAFPAAALVWKDISYGGALHPQAKAGTAHLTTGATSALLSGCSGVALPGQLTLVLTRSSQVHGPVTLAAAACCRCHTICCQWIVLRFCRGCCGCQVSGCAILAAKPAECKRGGSDAIGSSCEHE